eukprot:scaffold157998_cov66-Cyclotella_meneghiniana.AAC.3
MASTSKSPQSSISELSSHKEGKCIDSSSSSSSKLMTLVVASGGVDGWFVYLTESMVTTINWRKGDDFKRNWAKVGGMKLLNFLGDSVLTLIGSTV